MRSGANDGWLESWLYFSLGILLVPLSHRGLNSSHLSTLLLQDYMRLCFAWLTEEQLVEGVQHLKDLMEEKSE